MGKRTSFRPWALALIIVTGVVAFLCGLFLRLPGIPQTLLPFVVMSSPTPTLSPTYVALNVHEYLTYTVYWKRALWESAVSESVITEDFEKDEADYGDLSFPYLTGNGFLLRGQSAAQILGDNTLLRSENLLHLRDWKNGLAFGFPNGAKVGAFGFDYQPSETWQLAFNDSTVTIPKGRRGFVGIVIREGYVREFILSSRERVQGGLSVDNISYSVLSSP